MNIIRLMKKEFLQNIRDYRIFLIMTLFPVLLIYFVGTAFGGQFTSDLYGVEDLKVEILIVDDTEITRNMSESLEDQLNDRLDLGSDLRFVEDIDGSQYRLSKKLIDALIIIDEQSVTLYKNSRYTKQFTVIESILRSVVETSLSNEDENHSLPDNLVEVKVNESANYFNIMEYFALAFMVLFIMYGISNSITNTIREKKKDNTNRILLSPISKIELILGKVLAYVLVCTIQMLIVFVSTVVFFGMNWGGNYIAVMILMLSFVIVVITFGIMLGFLFDSEGAAVGLIHTLIVVLAFFSGSYMPLSGLGTLGEIGKYFSPAWWVIEGSLKLIYANSAELMPETLLINFGASIIFVLVTWLFVSKKEVL